MDLDTRQAFKFLQMNYRYGLLDEVGSIVGDALDDAMGELGMDMEDVLNRLDGADESTIEKMNDALERWSNLFFKVAANDTMTRLQARLLKIPAVRRGAVRAVRALLLRKLGALAGPCAAGVGGAARE